VRRETSAILIKQKSAEADFCRDFHSLDPSLTVIIVYRNRFYVVNEIPVNCGDEET
jgi:hypothetical protein